jgi:hypothetical protein
MVTHANSIGNLQNNIVQLLPEPKRMAIYDTKDGGGGGVCPSTPFPPQGSFKVM